MKRTLTVILFTGGEKAQGKRKFSAFQFPLLGRSPLEIAADLAASLKPDKKNLWAGPSGVSEKLRSAGWKLLEGSGKETPVEALAAAKAAFSEKERGDLLIIDPSFPLLSRKSLLRLLREHRREDFTLSFLSPDGEALFQPEKKASQTEKRKKNSLLIPAVVIRQEDFTAMEAEAFLSRPEENRGWEILFQYLRAKGKRVGRVVSESAEEFLDVQAEEERLRIISALRKNKIQALMARGVIFLDPDSVWIDLGVTIGRGTIISQAVVIEGDSRLGREGHVYPFVHIIDSRVGNRVTILSATMIEGSVLEDEVRIGPFAHLRPGTIVKAGAHVGNFVEMKKTVFGRGSKAGHLSYLGDSEVGDGVNIGAGTITCNYDGMTKHRTIIESGAFIGSGTELVAPVRVGKRAYVGAGSTITKDVSPDALAIARARQVEIPDWAKRRRKK